MPAFLISYWPNETRREIILRQIKKNGSPFPCSPSPFARIATMTTQKKKITTTKLSVRVFLKKTNKKLPQTNQASKLVEFLSGRLHACLLVNRYFSESDLTWIML